MLYSLVLVILCIYGLWRIDSKSSRLHFLTLNDEGQSGQYILKDRVLSVSDVYSYEEKIYGEEKYTAHAFNFAFAKTETFIDTYTVCSKNKEFVETEHKKLIEALK